MGIEYSKYTYRNLSEIILRKIECTFENISKLVESFYEKSFVLLVEDISNNSMVYKKMDELDVKYLFLKTRRGEKTTKAIIFLSILNYKEVLKLIMDETPENLFIFNLSEASQLKEYFNSISIHPKKLLKDKISTICIGVSVIERTIEMTFNLNVFDPSIIMEKMKNINMMDY